MKKSRSGAVFCKIGALGQKCMENCSQNLWKRPVSFLQKLQMVQLFLKINFIANISEIGWQF